MFREIISLPLLITGKLQSSNFEIHFSDILV